jgi:hypothetical protein
MIANEDNSLVGKDGVGQARRLVQTVVQQAHHAPADHTHLVNNQVVHAVEVASESLLGCVASDCSVLSKSLVGRRKTERSASVKPRYRWAQTRGSSHFQAADAGYVSRRTCPIQLSRIQCRSGGAPFFTTVAISCSECASNKSLTRR